MKRISLYLLLFFLFVFHQDFWLWGDSTLLLGFLPSGLAYHALYCIATSLLWYLMITYNWPAEAEAFAEGDPGEEASPE
jgi:hypothetical protein